MSVCLSQPVNSVLISPYDKQSMQTKSWLLQDWPWIWEQRTLIYRWRSLSHNTHRLCVCGCAVYIPPARELQPRAKPADHLSQECIRIPWIRRIHPPTHIKSAAWITFLGPAHKVPTNTNIHKHTRQSCNLRQTHTNSLFVSNPHIHTRSHTTILSWSCRAGCSEEDLRGLKRHHNHVQSTKKLSSTSFINFTICFIQQ